MAKCKLPQGLRQLIRRGHCDIVHKQGNNGNLSLQRRLYFETDKISRLLKSRTAIIIGHAQPFLTNDGEKNVAFADLFIDVFFEIDTQRYRVDVRKDGI